jgi:hypothetical protein
MTVEQIFDKALSFIFRLVTIIYALIIIGQNENYYETYWYYIVLIPYLIIYSITLNREGVISRIRLLNDYAFILFILYDKGVTFTSLTLLILPILNAPNHTGKKKSIILYLIFLLCLFVLNEYSFDWKFIYPTLTFLAINFLVESRRRYLNKQRALNEQIEDFFDRQNNLRKIYSVYLEILKMMNKSNWFLFYKPHFYNVTCFRVSNSSLKLIHGSNFVWSYNISAEGTLKLLDIVQNKPGYLKQNNIPIEINKELYNNNLWIHAKTNSSDYLYVYTIKEPSFATFNVFYIKLLQPIASRISRVLDLDWDMREEKKRLLTSYREKYFYVQNAEKAMHFLKNRMNSLDNFIEMSKDAVQNGMDSEDIELYTKELENVERNHKLLLERANSILSKSEKPFSSTELQPLKAIHVFNLVREIWLDFFKFFQFDLQWDIQNISKHRISLNHNGIFILFTDWIANMQKHSVGDEIAVFLEDDDFLYIKFINRYNPSRQVEQEVTDLMEDFNSEEKDRILKRTSHGVIFMKSIIEEMCIDGLIYQDKNQNTIQLELKFKKE